MKIAKTFWTAGSILLMTACSSTRVLVVRSTPAEADVCIKGTANSRKFSSETLCIGQTPLELESILVRDKKGRQRIVHFGDVNPEKDGFYIVISRKGYLSESFSVPAWEQDIALRADASPHRSLKHEASRYVAEQDKPVKISEPEPQAESQVGNGEKVERIKSEIAETKAIAAKPESDIEERLHPTTITSQTSRPAPKTSPSKNASNSAPASMHGGDSNLSLPTLPNIPSGPLPSVPNPGLANSVLPRPSLIVDKIPRRLPSRATTHLAPKQSTIKNVVDKF